MQDNRSDRAGNPGIVPGKEALKGREKVRI